MYFYMAFHQLPYAIVGSLYITVVDSRRFFKHERVMSDRSSQYMSINAIRTHETIRSAVVDIAMRAMRKTKSKGIHVALNHFNLPTIQVLDIQKRYGRCK